MSDAGQEKFDANTKPIVDIKLEKIKKIFPETWVEGKIQWDILKEALNGVVEQKNEVYAFSWAGKSVSRKILEVTSQGTLIPIMNDSVNFKDTSNMFVEGDNLEVMKLLMKYYINKIKMIYIDPPYNRGDDLIYQDNYKDPLSTYLKLTNQTDDLGRLLTTNPETSGRYHSAWLTMMYPRLYLAKELLSDNGVIFVSIDDHEIYNLRIMLNEIFGEENFLGTFSWQSKKGGGSDVFGLVQDQEYVICYCKNNSVVSVSKKIVKSEKLDKIDEKGSYRRGRELNKWGSKSRREDRPTMWFPIPGPGGVDVFPIRNDGIEGRWRWGKKKMMDTVQRGDVEFEKRDNGTYIVYEKIRSTEPRDIPFRTWLTDVGTTADGSKTVKELFDGKNVYDYPKPVKLIKKLLQIGITSTDDIVLDFFAGSCTTAHAVMEMNCKSDMNVKYICIQLPEPTPDNSIAKSEGYDTISKLGKERINRAMRTFDDYMEKIDLGYKFFKLNDSNFNIQKQLNIDHRDKENNKKQYLDILDKWIENPIKIGVSDLAVCYEIIIKEGYDFNSNIEEMEIGNNKIYHVLDNDRELYMCLNPVLDNKLKDELKTKHYNGTSWMLLDKSLTDSEKITLNNYINIKVI